VAPQALPQLLGTTEADIREKGALSYNECYTLNFRLP
jgi:hypothetical protein